MKLSEVQANIKSLIATQAALSSSLLENISVWYEGELEAGQEIDIDKKIATGVASNGFAIAIFEPDIMTIDETANKGIGFAYFTAAVDVALFTSPRRNRNGGLDRNPLEIVEEINTALFAKPNTNFQNGYRPSADPFYKGESEFALVYNMNFNIKVTF